MNVSESILFVLSSNPKENQYCSKLDLKKKPKIDKI